MTEDVRELYQQIILDHNKSPKNFREIENPDRRVEAYNPLCGDHYTIFLTLEGDRVVDISFQGSGCAISKASASVMTELVKGKSVEEAEHLFEQFHDLVTGKLEADMFELGKLAAFAGVQDYPARVKCASLSWHTMHAAITTEQESISTE
ncbi:MAG: SUF system NifU family Fe-S cluster assembly protein [Ignavibacteriae bacterium]|nr:SUF system NifU family Fe-S cluster assembly protein [Ignavibacteriota bacterium]MCB9217371.1 SUF system NifU family Fe-S cluster assembly protein [Ignavibacteria bacterium]